MNGPNILQYDSIKPLKTLMDKAINDQLQITDKIIYRSNFITMDDSIIIMYERQIVYLLPDLFVLITPTIINITAPDKTLNIPITELANMQNITMAKYPIIFTKNSVKINNLTCVKKYHLLNNTYVYNYDLHSLDDKYSVNSNTLLSYNFNSELFDIQHEYDNINNTIIFQAQKHLYIKKVKYVHNHITEMFLQYDIGVDSYIIIKLTLDTQGNLIIMKFTYVYIHVVSVVSIMFRGQEINVSILEVINDKIIKHSYLINDERYHLEIEDREDIDFNNYEVNNYYSTYVNYYVTQEDIKSLNSIESLYQLVTYYYNLPEIN